MANAVGRTCAKGMGALVSAMVAAAVAFILGQSCGAAPIDAMVPISPAHIDAETLAKDLRMAREKWGLRRFVITNSGAENIKTFDDTCTEPSRLRGEYISDLRKRLAGTDIELGWWFCPTLRQGMNAPGQHIVDCEGHVTPGCCPLDSGFQKAFGRCVEAGCRAGKPFIVFFEDDFETGWHPGVNDLGGCFCPLHLKAFAARYGKPLSAKEIEAAFRAPNKANEPVRQAFADVQRESLVAFAKAIRAGIDRADPTIRTCLCQSGKAWHDGDFSEAVTRALAGKTRPAIRISGSCYSNENRLEVLTCAGSHLAYDAMRLPDDIEKIHEADPYPHTRFYNSTTFLGSLISAAYMRGVENTYLYCSMYDDDPFEDPGYAEWFARNRTALATVRDFRRRAKPAGLRITVDPKEEYLSRIRRPDGHVSCLAAHAMWIFGKLGFPTSFGDGAVTFLSATTAELMSDDEIRKVLSGPTFLDAAAAAHLQTRGFSDLMGVRAEGVAKLPSTAERILPAAGCRHRGKQMMLGVLDSVKDKTPVALLAALPGTEVWAEIYDWKSGKGIAPSVTFAVNSLGGRVGVLAEGVEFNRKVGMFNARKQELLDNLLFKLTDGRFDVTSTATPGMWLLACKTDDELLFMAENLAGETRDDVAFRFGTPWQGGAVCCLREDGAWQPCGTVGERWSPGVPFESTIPVFFKVKRANPSRKIRVACIGDSITWGTAMTNRVAECYPAQLQRLLGDGYDVRNFGVPGSGVYSHPQPGKPGGWTPSVWRANKLAKDAYAFAPDIVVSNLGINNATDYMRELTPVGNGTFVREPGTFAKEYVDLLEAFCRGRAERPRLIIWTRLGPLSKNHGSKGRPGPFAMECALEHVAASVGAETLDMYTPLVPYAETAHFAADGVHPEGGAQREIAVLTARRIKGEN